MQIDVLLEHIGTLYTLEGEKRPRSKEALKAKGVRDGVVAVFDGQIIYGGAYPLPEEIQASENTQRVDCTDKVVTPGLIDAHTHLVHGGSREKELAMKIAGADYLEIYNAGLGIYSTQKATREADFQSLYDKARKSLDVMLAHGTTTVEAKSGYGIWDFQTEIKQMQVAHQLNANHPVDVVSTFMGAHAMPAKYKENPDEYIRILTEEMMPFVKEERLAEFVDVFCEEGVFDIEQSRKILTAAKKLGFGLKIHADEIVSLGGARLAAKLPTLSAEHLIAASDKGIQDMAKAGVIACLLPGTSFNLGKGKYAKARQMVEQGVSIALCTDYNPGSCPTENLQLIMTFAALYYRLLPEEILTAVTYNAACAIGRQEKIGSLEKGKEADLILWDAPNLDYIPYHFGVNHVERVWKKGKEVWRKAE